MRPVLAIRRRYVPSSRAAPPSQLPPVYPRSPAPASALLPRDPHSYVPRDPHSLPPVREAAVDFSDDSQFPVHPPEDVNVLAEMSAARRRAQRPETRRNAEAFNAMMGAITANVRDVAESTTQFFDLVSSPATPGSAAQLLAAVNKLSTAVLLAQVHHETLLYIDSDAEVTPRDAWEHAATMIRQRHEFASSVVGLPSRHRASGLTR